MKKLGSSDFFIFIQILFILGIIPGIPSDNNSDPAGRSNPDESKVLLEEVMSIGVLEGDSHYSCGIEIAP